MNLSALSLKLYIVSIIFLIIIVLLALINNIIKCENNIKNAFSSIDIILKKRYDLIPNLIESIKGYMQYEKEILTIVTKLRTKKLSLEEKIEENKNINEKLNYFYINEENYPELKANKLFQNLTNELIKIENELTAARRAYNANVLKYNNTIMTFPSIIFAKIMRKKKYEIFEIELSARKKIKIDINK